MRILVDTFGSDAGKSGIGQCLVQLLRRLPAAAPDIQFDIVLFEGEEQLYIPEAENVHAMPKNGPLHNTLVNLAWHQVVLPRLCAHDYDVLFLPTGRRLPYHAPCPSVAIVYDLAPLHVENKYDRLHMFYNLHVMPRFIRNLTRVLTNSESSKRDIMRHVGLPEERLTVIPLGVDHERYHLADRAQAFQRLKERYGIEGPFLMFTSRVEHPGKNHFRLIRAFNRLKRDGAFPHQLVLVGSDWSRAEEVHQEAAASPFRSDIRFTGFVPSEDLPSFYHAADVFVFPSLFEGFGMPVLEAMACGKPVACSNVASLPEVAGDAAVLFDPYAEDSIEDAMRSLLTDSSLRQRCTDRGLERSQQFTWANAAKQVVNELRRAHEEHRH